MAKGDKEKGEGYGVREDLLVVATREEPKNIRRDGFSQEDVVRMVVEEHNVFEEEEDYSLLQRRTRIEVRLRLRSIKILKSPRS